MRRGFGSRKRVRVWNPNSDGSSPPSFRTNHELRVPAQALFVPKPSQKVNSVSLGTFRCQSAQTSHFLRKPTSFNCGWHSDDVAPLIHRNRCPRVERGLRSQPSHCIIRSPGGHARSSYLLHTQISPQRRASGSQHPLRFPQ